MKLALLSDLHANLPACEAALHHAREEGFDKLAVLGDIVGILGWPDETVEFVEKHADYAVLGNHDMWILDDDFVPDSSGREREMLFVESMLTNESREFLSSLPLTKELADDVTIAHANPYCDNPTGHPADDYLSKRQLTSFGSQHMDGQTVCVGHTHIQYAQSLDKFEGMSGLVVNPGSVGAPWYKDARWAMLDTEEQTATLHRSHYDDGELTDRFNKLGLKGWSKK